MPLPYTVVFEPPTAAELIAALRTRAALALLMLLVLLGAMGAAVLTGWWPVGPAAEPGPGPGAVPLAVTSEPAGARVWVDGRERGRTPTTIQVPPGPHTLVLRRSGWLEARLQVEVAADASGEPQAVGTRLWRQQPTATRLRPTYPGATIADARFLHDGRVALIVSLPPGDQRQAWLLEPSSGAWRRVDPAGARAGGIAVAPDGARVAYLARGATAGAPGGPEWLDELWVAPVAGAADSPTARGARRYVLPSQTTAAGERLVDLAWAPDSRHLLLAVRQQVGVASGRTQLLWLDADDAAETPPRELVVLPSELVPGSYAWAPDGQRVAFLARTNTRLVALCVVDASGEFRYLADVGREDLGQPLPMPPLAWTPDGDSVVYAAPPPKSSGWSLFGGAAPAPALFSAPLADPAAARRLGEAAGAAPVWRDAADLLVLARGGEGRLGLRAVDPAGGETSDLADLPLKAAGAFTARWDIAHGQALVAVRGGDALGGAATPEYWLVRFLAREAPRP